MRILSCFSVALYSAHFPTPVSNTKPCCPIHADWTTRLSVTQILTKLIISAIGTVSKTRNTDIAVKRRKSGNRDVVSTVAKSLIDAKSSMSAVALRFAYQTTNKLHSQNKSKGQCVLTYCSKTAIVYYMFQLCYDFHGRFRYSFCYL